MNIFRIRMRAAQKGNGLGAYRKRIHSMLFVHNKSIDCARYLLYRSAPLPHLPVFIDAVRRIENHRGSKEKRKKPAEEQIGKQALLITDPIPLHARLSPLSCHAAAQWTNEENSSLP